MIKKNTTAESLPNTETVAVKYNLKQDRLIDDAMAADSLCAFDNLMEENKTERQEGLKHFFLNYQKEFMGFFSKAEFFKLRDKNIKNALANLNKNKKIARYFIDNGYLFIITVPLVFTGTNQSGSSDTSDFTGLVLGRQVIRTRLVPGCVAFNDEDADDDESNYIKSSLDSNISIRASSAIEYIQVKALDWIISENSTPVCPCISENGYVCYGGNKRDVAQLYLDGKIDLIIPYIIKALESPDYENPYREMRVAIDRLAFIKQKSTKSIASDDIARLFNHQRRYNTRNFLLSYSGNLANEQLCEYSNEINRSMLINDLPKYPELARAKNIIFTNN